MKYILIALVIVAAAVVVTACRRRKPSQLDTPPFRMRVENVFFIRVSWFSVNRTNAVQK